MAERPIFIPAPEDDALVREIFLPIKWHSGFALVRVSSCGDGPSQIQTPVPSGIASGSSLSLTQDSGWCVDFHR